MAPNQQPNSNNLSDEDRLEQEDQKVKEQNNTFFFVLGALPIFPIRNQQIIYNAFSVVANPRFAQNLIDFQNPAEYLRGKEALRTTTNRFKKKNIGPGGSLTTKTFPFSKVTLTTQTLDRNRQLGIIAGRLHKRVNQIETTLRTQTGINTYLTSRGITIDPQQFQKSVQQFLQNNPGRNLNEAINITGTRYYLSTKEGLSIDVPTDEAAQKQLDGQYREAQKKHGTELEQSRREYTAQTKPHWEQAIKTAQSDSTFQGLKTLFDRTSNQNNPIQSAGELRTQLQTIEQGTQTTPQAQPQTQPAPVISPLTPSPSVLPSVSIPPPLSQPAVPGPVVSGNIRINSLRGFLNNLQTRLATAANRIGTFINRIPGFNLLGRGFSAVGVGLRSFGNGVLKKLGLASLVAPGVGTAVAIGHEALNAITGGLLGKAERWVVLGIILVPVGLVLLVVVLVSTGTTPYYGKQNAKPVPIKMPFSSWNDFEKEFLTADKQKTNDQPQNIVSWDQFERESLLLLKKQLSLEKK